jgi:ADP-heptose:LPS heptosyltransferase
MSETQKILVIKLGALGDFIQALGPMAAIRRHHPDAHITLMTTKPYENFAIDCGYFNQVYVDEKPAILNFSGWMRLAKFLNGEKFTRVYDLQNNDRTGIYFKLFSKKPEWVGIAKGASHRNTSPDRSAGHAFDAHVQTLMLAGIADVKPDPLEWMQANISTFALRKPYVLLVPGSAPERPEKRWSADSYARLAQILVQLGYQPVIIGGPAEIDTIEKIMRSCPEALNLAGMTTLQQIAVLARDAAAAIGNDTGPMHLIAATGCPSVAVFSKYSNPVKHAPRGAKVQVVAEDNLDELSPEKVLSSFRPRQEPPKKSASLH